MIAHLFQPGWSWCLANCSYFGLWLNGVRNRNKWVPSYFKTGNGIHPSTITCKILWLCSEWMSCFEGFDWCQKKVMVVVGVMKSLSESCFGRALMLRSIRDYDRYLICSKNIITRDITWVVWMLIFHFVNRHMFRCNF